MSDSDDYLNDVVYDPLEDDVVTDVPVKPSQLAVDPPDSTRSKSKKDKKTEKSSSATALKPSAVSSSSKLSVVMTSSSGDPASKSKKLSGNTSTSATQSSATSAPTTTNALLTQAIAPSSSKTSSKRRKGRDDDDDDDEFEEIHALENPPLGVKSMSSSSQPSVDAAYREALLKKRALDTAADNFRSQVLDPSNSLMYMDPIVNTIGKKSTVTPDMNLHSQNITAWFHGQICC